MHDERETQQQPDEVEAHGFSARGRNEDARPPEAVEREQAIPDADDDVEGHGARFNG